MFGLSQAKEMIANKAALGLHSGVAKNEGMAMSTETRSKSGAQVEKVKSRFGEISVDKEKALLFPVGVLGMPDMHHFVLTDFPNPKLGQFKLLQSLDDVELSFITLPLELDNSIIGKEDIEHAAKDMEIPLENLAMVLIVSVHRGVADVQLSVNARAPIFIDTSRMAAAQYVFTSNKYRVQHFITAPKA